MSTSPVGLLVQMAEDWWSSSVTAKGASLLNHVMKHGFPVKQRFCNFALMLSNHDNTLKKVCDKSLTVNLTLKCSVV